MRTHQILSCRMYGHTLDVLYEIISNGIRRYGKYMNVHTCTCTPTLVQVHVYRTLRTVQVTCTTCKECVEFETSAQRCVAWRLVSVCPQRKTARVTKCPLNEAFCEVCAKSVGGPRGVGVARGL